MSELDELAKLRAEESERMEEFRVAALAEIAALAAERDRLREALEQIADTYDANDECRWCGTEIDMDHYEDCASVLARAALAPGTPVDVE